jgi:hypothetical protein
MVIPGKPYDFFLSRLMIFVSSLSIDKEATSEASYFLLEYPSTFLPIWRSRRKTLKTTMQYAKNSVSN